MRQLTVAAAADVQKTRLPAGAEPLVGLVLRPVGKHGPWRHEPIQGDPQHLACALVNQLQGSEQEQEVTTSG